MNKDKEVLFSVVLTEDELKLFSEFQKEFGARERKVRRKYERAQQNVEMHSNRAIKRANQAVKAVKSGDVELADTLQKSAQKAIDSTSHDIKRLADQGKKIVGSNNVTKVQETVNAAANTASKAEKVVSNAANKVSARKLVAKNKKGLIMMGGLAAGAGLIGAGIAHSKKKVNE